MAESEVLDRLEGLVTPFGVVADVHSLPAPRGLGEITSCLAFAGFLPAPGAPGHHLACRPSRPARAEPANPGHGMTVDDPAQARLISIAEAAERYSAGDFGQPEVWASYQELDGPALDPRRIPRCSPRELATPGCPLRAPDPRARIRWARGVDLGTGEPTWIPAIMAFYGLRNAVPAEKFWYQISTGFAVHSDPAEALARGLCEVAERDALAVAWLQRLALPVVAGRDLTAAARRLVTWARRHFIDSYLFDATTDVGVPTVLCLQVARHDRRCAQVVGCATGRDIGSAAEKALLEGCRGRSLDCRGDPPESFADFTSLTDGACFMAGPERAPAFGFLVDGAAGRVAPGRPSLPDDPVELLGRLVATLSGQGMQVLAVDRTTRELAAVGLTAVNVIVPELQPMTLLPLAQYRAHPRLYSAPVLMGYPSLTEEELNPWPVPYA